MNPIWDYLLSNVPAGTADLFAYLMLVVVAIFLISGPIIAYIFYKKYARIFASSVRGKTAEATEEKG